MSAAAQPCVMLVEDDVDVIETLGELLEERGYRTVRARDGAQALKLLREDRERPDLILLDLMMPNMDGWQFRVEQRNDPASAAIPVVVLTADTDPHGKAGALEAAACLRKPVGLGELMELVSRLCGTPGGKPG